MNQFTYNLTLEELERRCIPTYLSYCSMLTKFSPEYIKLLEGDKQALTYLVKAAKIIGDIELSIDNCHNRDVLAGLMEEEKKGDGKASHTKNFSLLWQVAVD